MPFLWTPELSVGVARLDEQHRELMARADALRRLLAEDDLVEEEAGRRGGPAALDLLRYLVEYVEEHFDEEERLMDEVAFPAREAHLDEHCRFEATLRRLVATFARTGAGPSLSAEVEREVCAWIRAHILSTDQALGHHARRAQLA
jgi:hemerythrin